MSIFDKKFKFVAIAVALLHLPQPAFAWDFYEWVDATFNGGKEKAKILKKDEMRRKEIDVHHSVNDSCKEKVRNTLSNPSTIQFTNIPSVEETDGGYRVSLHGNYSDGVFHVNCYTDLSYRVTSFKYYE